MRQLTIDGKEIEYQRTVRREPPLTDLQREALRYLTMQGQIRSVEAGVMVHSARGHCGYGAKDDRVGGRRDSRISCCNYAATDGNELMKRLMERGIVRRVSERGPWVRVNPDG
jgi:hypothetical protein